MKSKWTIISIMMAVPLVALAYLGSVFPAALATGGAAQAPQRGDTAKQAPGPIEGGLQRHALWPEGVELTEDFESGVMPPSGWTRVIKNTNFPTTTWSLLLGSIPPGIYAAQVQYDPYLSPQDEWLLSPELTLSEGTLSFWSFGSLFWCKKYYDNCDLEVWLVVGNVGGTDDIYVGVADDDWSASWTWAQSVFDLSSLLPPNPVRIGFRYIGLDGAQVGLDNISLETECNPVHNADFSWTPFNPAVGQVVTFNGSAAGDSPITYSWAFGGGSAGAGATVTHTYSSAGVYTVTMPVSNACGSDMALRSLSVFPHYATYYAFVNQPWDWVEGRCMPNATVQATLRRSGSPLATASTTANSEGFFALEFRDSYGHIDILAGDEIVLVGGGVDGTLVVVDTIGGINVAADTVVGLVTGGEFPAQGTVWVSYATNRAFQVRPIAIDAQGRFMADFSGQLDINDDHIAKVVYQDPRGNEVVQVFYPGGLDVRTLISEDRIEGVAAPGTLVRALVADANGPKGTGEATADETGFYSMRLYDRGHPVDLSLGDRITVTKPGRTRQVELTMYHVSTMQPWSGRIDGTVYGVSLPTEGTEGQVDLWSAAQKRWYTKYIAIGPDGSYGVDFSDLVEMTSADVMRLWVTLPDGTQQAALGWPLHAGVSTSDDTVWGFTTVSSTVQITLYRGLVSGVPVDVIGTASATADKRGYFSTTIMVGGSPHDIMPSNVVMVRAGEHVKTLFVGLLDLRADVENDALLVFGPAGSVVHIEGRRHGVLREDAPYQEDYVWAESTVAPNGKALFGPLPFDVQVDDWFDVTCYLLEEGLAFHRLVAVPAETISISMAYLPLVFRHAGP